MYRAREATRFQFIVDLLDFWVPATNLGLVNLNDGFVGIFGYVSFTHDFFTKQHIDTQTV